MKRHVIARELTVEVVVGVFIVMILLGLGYFTIILSREAWFGEQYHLEVTFNDVLGLRQGDSVVVRGMPVGQVHDLFLETNHVRVVVRLDRELQMHSDSRISIVPTSVLGGRYLQIHEGSADSKRVPLSSVFEGEPTHDVMTDAAELLHALRDDVTGEGGTLENLRIATANVREITDRINQGEGMLGRLVSSDDELYNDLAAAAAALREISVDLKDGRGVLGRMLTTDDGLYEDLAVTMSSVRKVAERIEQGRGLIGRLTQDDELYEDIKRIVDEARATLDDVRETTPVVTFSSILFGAF